jgi:hypothetical protein
MVRSRSIFIAAVFILGCAVGGGASRFVVPPANAANVQRWDYFCFMTPFDEGILAKAKQAGAGGWEMVLVAVTPSGNNVCFKRPL